MANDIICEISSENEIVVEINGMTYQSVAAELALKADKTYVDDKLSEKADKTYVDNQDAALTAQLAEIEKPEYARVFVQPSISIPHNTNTTLVFNGTREDAESLLDASKTKFVIKKSGIYILWAGIVWGASTVGTRKVLFLVNGTRVIANSTVNGSNGLVQTAETLIKLVEGDYVECVVQQTSGAAINVSYSGGEQGTDFAIARLK